MFIFKGMAKFSAVCFVALFLIASGFYYYDSLDDLEYSTEERLSSISVFGASGDLFGMNEGDSFVYTSFCLSTLDDCYAQFEQKLIEVETMVRDGLSLVLNLEEKSCDSFSGDNGEVKGSFDFSEVSEEVLSQQSCFLERRYILTDTV